MWKHDHHYWTRQANISLMESVATLLQTCGNLNGHHDSFMLFSHYRMSRWQQMQNQRNVLKYVTFLNGMWKCSNLMHNAPWKFNIRTGHWSTDILIEVSILVYFWGTLWYSTLLFSLNHWLFSLLKGSEHWRYIHLVIRHGCMCASEIRFKKGKKEKTVFLVTMHWYVYFTYIKRKNK